MYAILISIALAAYSLILVDFTNLFQEISVNADLLTSAQALYTAEGVAEQAFYQSRSDHDVTKRNTRFITVSKGGQQGSDNFFEYNEGAGSTYLRRKLVLNEENLSVSDRTVLGNRATASGLLDSRVLFDPEPLASRGFVIRQVESDKNFNEIRFSYNQGTENSNLLFEVFAFPRDGDEIDFSDFKTIKEGGSSSVSRLSINTLDTSKNGMPQSFPGHSFVINFGNGKDSYKSQLSISGFQPLSNNYLIRFQSLDNKPIHYSLSSYYGNGLVRLPNLTQTVDVIGITPTGLFQRVKMQRQTEEGLMPGLQFVHFTNAPINK